MSKSTDSARLSHSAQSSILLDFVIRHSPRPVNPSRPRRGPVGRAADTDILTTCADGCPYACAYECNLLVRELAAVLASQDFRGLHIAYLSAGRCALPGDSPLLRSRSDGAPDAAAAICIKPNRAAVDWP